MSERADARSRLLEAAARVYARHGSTGATTRQIAESAEVNEVTIFRLFGSKDALLEEAIRTDATREAPAALPDEPAEPLRELSDWCRAEIARLRRSRDLMRMCFAESGEHPAHVRCAVQGTEEAGVGLRRYVDRLAARGLVRPAADRQAAMSMLLSALLADALGRDEMPGLYPGPASKAPERYARVFLVALGVGELG
jgi:AcrR family transcriptional regulator